MDRNNNLFNPSKEFFIIDSNNLDKVENKLFGFALKNNDIIRDTYIEEENIYNGAFINIISSDSEIVISQDFMGSYGLYIYQNKNYFAISNSFVYLLDYLKFSKEKISFNNEYANAFLSGDIYSLSYDKTLINEINVVERNAKIHIDKISKNLSFEYLDFEENSVDVDSQMFFDILDNWYLYWINFIRNLKTKTNNIRVDLSGGFDSRLTFLLFLGAGINFNEIWINSTDDKLHTHEVDFKIASEIANHYGFKLNDKNNINLTSKNFSIQDILNISSYLKLGFHKQFNFKNEKRLSTEYLFGGTGGECIRHYYKMNEKEFINKQLYFPYGDINYTDLINSTTNIVKDSCNKIRNKFVRLNRKWDEDYLTINLFRDTYCRNHFCKQTLEEYFANQIRISPLLDINLHKLKLGEDQKTNKDLLNTIIFTRYNKDILNFKFEHGEINKEILNKALELNSKYPLNIELPKDMVSINSEIVFNSDTINNCPKIPIEEIKKVYMDFLSANSTQKFLELFYDKQLISCIITDSSNRQYHSLQLSQPLIAIYKVLKDVIINENYRNNYVSDFILYSNNVYSKRLNNENYINTREKIKNSFIENIFSIKNEYRKTNKIKILTVMFIKFKFNVNKER